MKDSGPAKKDDAAQATDGDQSQQKTVLDNENCNPGDGKTQPNAFKITKATGVVFPKFIKDMLNNKLGCRYNSCFDAYVCPISRKEETKALLDKYTFDTELIDISADVFSKSRIIDTLETQLHFIEKEIHKLSNQFLILAEKQDPSTSYHNFEVEPQPHDPHSQDDDLRFRNETDLYELHLKISSLKRERTNLRNSLTLHLKEETDWPDPKPIKGALRKVPPFDAETLLPSPLREWILDEADRMPCSPDFIGAGALVNLGALIGTRCAVRPKSSDNWLVVPNLWGANIGMPSSKKSPASSVALNPLGNLMAQAREAYQSKLDAFEISMTIHNAEKEAIESKIKSAAKASKKDNLNSLAEELNTHKQQLPKNPLPKRYKSNDTTIEKLGELLQDNPQGILIFRDELTGLLASWEKEGREGDRAFFLEGWDGKSSFDTDRIKRGSVFIPNLCISIFGGIQPDKLIPYLEQATKSLSNDGMLQRFQVMVYPDQPTWEWRNRAPNADIRHKVISLFEKLADFNPLDWDATPPGDNIKFPCFSFDYEAQEIFIKFTTRIHLEIIPKETNPLISQHLEKYDKLFPAIALIFHLVDCAEHGHRGPIKAQSAIKAVAWCEYLEEHARRSYGLLADDGLRAAQALAEKIQKGALTDGFT
ncbi:MAG: DUF3987 domain-containing protein, partial [Chlamydiales bacterium]|nr:DUF3987 domain-containing protein [Chlamydiales bacterium]